MRTALAALVMALAASCTQSVPTPSPSATPPIAGLPSAVDGLAVYTVSALLRDRASGALGGDAVAVGGYWSSLLIAHSCAPPTGNPGVLEMYCHDHEYGITEQDEPVTVLNPDNSVVAAKGPNLTPYIADLADAGALLRQVRPEPIVVVGHFDDARAGDCRPDAVQLCRDRLVLERMAFFANLLPATQALPPLSISNETSIVVTVLVNGAYIDMIQPGQARHPIAAPLPNRPWTIEVLSQTRRVLLTLTISDTDVITSNSGKAARVDLSCGRLDVWSGPPLLGPAPGPGIPGDCL